MRAEVLKIERDGKPGTMVRLSPENPDDIDILNAAIAAGGDAMERLAESYRPDVVD